ncbi:MAG TPA: SDR family oxidoreductase [Ktedonobacterales bacterium]|nr:SDR family oxidoreductase [Ktedonobacterales bacterium]
MNKPTGAVLVTGASSGMGKACALLLSQAGYTVFAGVRKERDAQMLTQAGSSRLIPVILDVTDENTIAEAYRTIHETVGDAGLVGLVNNAGVGVTAPIELVPLDELRRQFEINVIGQVAVTQAFLPLIRAARGRIINVGSVGGKITLPFGGPLCSSKYAIESINDALRMELRPWGIHVALVAPGSIHTPAVDKLVTDSEAMVSAFSPEGKARYAATYRAFVQAFLKLEEEGVSPDVMAQTVYHALTARAPKARYPVGPKSRLLAFLGVWLPAGALDIVRTRMFQVYQPFDSVVSERLPALAHR